MLRKTISVFVLVLISIFSLREAIFRNLLFIPPEFEEPVFSSAALEGFSPETFLSGTFSFLGAGSQCLVFTKKEEDFVLKICKAGRYGPFLPFVSRTDRHRKKYHDDLRNYTTAFEKLSDSTGIVYLHLHTTPSSGKRLILKDPAGIPYFVDPSRLVFYIQKKTVPFDTYMKTVSESDRSAIGRKILTMVEDNFQKGVFIKDCNPEKNIGFYNETPVWIDPGRMLHYSSPPSEPEKEKFLGIIRNYLAPIFPISEKTDPAEFFHSN